MDRDRQPALDAAGAAGYVALSTYRKSGAPVVTPVWVARDGDELVVITVDGTGKTKRLSRDPSVSLQPCDFRGRIDAGAPTWTGTARVVRGDVEIAAVKKAIADKYVLARLGDAVAHLTRGLTQRGARAGIRITLTQPTAADPASAGPLP
ncbi:MAG: PPOX class F420-dependent oxidoreductase [Terracoccus sp.]